MLMLLKAPDLTETMLLPFRLQENMIEMKRCESDNECEVKALQKVDTAESTRLKRNNIVVVKEAK